MTPFDLVILSGMEGHNQPSVHPTFRCMRPDGNIEDVTQFPQNGDAVWKMQMTDDSAPSADIANIPSSGGNQIKTQGRCNVRDHRNNNWDIYRLTGDNVLVGGVSNDIMAYGWLIRYRPPII